LFDRNIFIEKVEQVSDNALEIYIRRLFNFKDIQREKDYLMEGFDFEIVRIIHLSNCKKESCFCKSSQEINT
jgi:hypothetical protein